MEQQGSLAFRKSREAIYQGDVPGKYNRILPYVSRGNTVLEIGAAEGVLSLLLAKQKDKVVAVERSASRHREALSLQNAWKDLGFDVDRCTMVHADIANRLDLLDGIDTVVAVRTIYYLKKDLDKVFTNISRKQCRFVVLVGNANRALSYKEDKLLGKEGKRNYYASSKGMVDILTKYGYKIKTVITEAPKVDPLVVGILPVQKSSTLPGYRMKRSLFPHLSKAGVVGSIDQIEVVDYRDTILPIEDAIEKSKRIVEQCHVALLEEFERQGVDNPDRYLDTDYWKRHTATGPWEHLRRPFGPAVKIKQRMVEFFRLYVKIKKEGFQHDRRNPLMVTDLKGIADLKWRFHRCNGSHRLAIARMLGLQEVPVLMIDVRIRDA